MLKKIKDLLNACYTFWKTVVFSDNRRDYIMRNIESLKTQIIVLLVVLFSALVLYQAMKPTMKGICRIVLRSNEDNNMAAMMDGRIVGVEAKKVVSGTTLRQVRSIGTLKANAEVVIKSEIPGKIKEILFTEGTEVEEGEELIRFDDEGYIAERDKAEATYTLHKAEYERMNKLYKQNVGALKDYDKALAQMNESKAALAQANYHLSKTSIKAPFSGTIGIMKVPAGNIVQQYTDLVTIVDNSNVKVEFSVPAKFVEDIAVGQSVEITVDSFRDKVFSGMVDAIDSEIDTKNHSILVRAVIPNPNGLLKHGLFASVTLVTGEKNDVLLIDEEALDRDGSIEFVWAIDDKGRAHKKRVLTGARDDNGVEITAGLTAGEYVVTAGNLKLSEGAKVKILNINLSKEGGEVLGKAVGGVLDEEVSDADVDKPEVKKGGMFRNIIKKFTRKKDSSQPIQEAEDNDSSVDNPINEAPGISDNIETPDEQTEPNETEPNELDTEESTPNPNVAENEAEELADENPGLFKNFTNQFKNFINKFKKNEDSVSQDEQNEVPADITDNKSAADTAENTDKAEEPDDVKEPNASETDSNEEIGN